MALENDDQKTFWERFAEMWVTRQDDLDTLFDPILRGTLQRADLKAGDHVMDIGCGTGQSSLKAAAAVAPGGHVTGIDISEPMLARARTLAAPGDAITFTTADAADHPFTPGHFDAAISRFGTMFFADPVAAFSNICKAIRPNGVLAMSCWSDLGANPWFAVPSDAAKKQLGTPPSIDPDSPGPLAFRNIDRVCGILRQAGFTAVEGEAAEIELTPKGDLHHVASLAASIGPAARIMEHFQGSESDFMEIAADVETDYAGYVTASGIRIPAEINFFTARAPQG